MTRIALIITELEPGGAERAMVELACRTDRSRFCPSVYVLASPPRNPMLLERLNEAKIPVRFALLSTSCGLKSMVTLYRAVSQLRRWFDEDKIELVQSFLFHANFISRLAGQAIVPSTGRKPILISGYRVCEPRRGQNFLDWATRRWADYHTSVGENVADYYFPDRKIQNQNRIEVIRNGVDVNLFTTQRRANRESVLQSMGISSNSTVLLSVGRLSAQKGFAELIKAMVKWIPQYPSVVYLIAGQGELESKLKSIIQKNGLESQIRLLGFQTAMPDLYAAANILLIPSLWEGVPNAALEAAASGLAVVSFYNPDLIELLQQGSVRQFTSFRKSVKNDLDVFCELTRYFLDRPELTCLTGLANRVRICQRCSWTAMAEQYQALWSRLISERE